MTGDPGGNPGRVTGMSLDIQGTVEGKSMSGAFSALACEANIVVTGTWQASKVK